MDKTQLLTHTETELTEEQVSWIQQGYVQYVEDKKPLEYILGYVAFLGVKFHVSPDTLIPRPETEYMIQAVNEHIQNTPQPQGSPYNVLDVGTGCGVLGLSSLYHNKAYIDTVLLTELSEEALEVAKQNANSLSLTSHVSFLKANLLDHPDVYSLLQQGPTILVANLPYIPDQMFDENVEDNVKKWEPRMAFVGGDDGNDLYRIMFDQLLENAPHADVTMFLEMMTRQVDILRQEYGEKLTFEEVKTFHFNIRIVKAVLK